MFPSRVNKSLSPATRQRMQCLRFSTIIIRVMTTVKKKLFRALYRFLSFCWWNFVNILFYITSILIVEFLLLILMEITFSQHEQKYVFLIFALWVEHLSSVGEWGGAGLCEARASISFILSRGDMSHQTTCGPVLVPLLCWCHFCTSATFVLVLVTLVHTCNTSKCAFAYS